MLKNGKKWILLVCLLVLGFSGSVLAAGKANGWDAAAKHYYKNGKALTGLQKIGGNTYYFNSKGVVQKNKWKKLKVDGTKYSFYFGKTGAAYKAKKNDYEVAFKTYVIKGKTYGFDEEAHMVTGVWATPKGKAYVFDKKGVYDAKKSKALRAVTKSRLKSDKLMDQVLALCGEPKKTETYSSCNFFASESDQYTDYKFVYSHVTVELTADTTTGVCSMMGIFPLFKE